MRILIFSPRPCDPPDTGAKLREYHLARNLAENNRVDLLAFQTGEPCRPVFFDRVVTVPRPKRYTPFKILAGLLSGEPVSLLNYRSGEMIAALQEMLRGEAYDVILLESIHMAAYRRQLGQLAKGALLVWDWHNIESELMERYAVRTKSLPHKLYALETARRLRRLEDELCRGDGHIVCSKREQEIVQNRYRQARIEVIANGVNLEQFGNLEILPEGRHRVLFVGSMDYHPNVEGVKYIARQVWPEVSRRNPGQVFTIVGSNPVSEVRELGELAGVEVTGRVETVESYYREASVVVVPLFEGGGTRLKVVEALAAGVPVVSTAVGVEGIAIEEGRHYVLAETESQWVEAISALMSNPLRWRDLANHGREVVGNEYDWKAIGSKLERTLGKWVGKG